MAQLQSTNITGSLNVTDTTFLGGNLRMANGTIIGVLGGETLRLGKTSGGGSVDIALGGSIIVENSFTINNTTGITFGSTAGSNKISANTAENFLFTKSGGGTATYEFSDTVDKILFGNQGNIGINTSTPSAKLHIVGANNLSNNYALKVQNSSSVDILTVENDGKVGINVSNPSYDLELPTSATVKIGNLIIDANGNSGAGTQMLSGGNEITIGSALIPQPTGYNLGKSSRVWGSLYMKGNIYGSLGSPSLPDYWGFLATDGYRDDSHYSYLPPLVSFAIGNTPSTYRGYFGIIQPSGSDNLNTDAATKFGLFVIGPGGRTILGKTQYNRTNDSIPKDKMFTIYDGETSTDELFYIMTGSGDTYLKGSLTASGLNYPTTDGIDRQVLKTDGNGNLSFGYAENVEIAVKNVSGGEIPKGTPCYITASGTQGNTAGIIPADAGNPNLMPAGLIAGETLAAEAEGVGLVNGFIQGVDTSTFNSGDTVYIAVGGGYTNVKPTGSGVFIQKLGSVEKVDSNGSGVINGPGYYNDLPNWETGKVMVGTDTYPATSSVIHLDEANGTLTVEGSGSTVFEVNGSEGQLFSITDSLSGSLFAVSDVSGLPILEVFSDDRVVAGAFNQNDFVISGSKVGIGTSSPSEKLHIDGNILIKTANSSSKLIFDNTDAGVINEIFEIEIGTHNNWGEDYIKIGPVNNSGLKIYGNTNNKTAVTINQSELVNDSTSTLRVNSISGSQIGLIKIASGLDTQGSHEGITFGDRSKSAIYHIQTQNGGFNAGDLAFAVEGTTTGTAVSTAHERMRITKAGNVGIGTTTPDARLIINGSGQSTAALDTSANLGASLILSDSNTAGAYGSGGSLIFGGTGSAGNLGRFAAIKGLLTNSVLNSVGDIAFSTRNNTADSTLTERLRIKNDGKIGIGTSIPSASLHIKGANDLSDNYALRVGNSNTDNILVVENDGKVGIGTDNPSYGLHLITGNGFKLTGGLGSSGEEVKWLLHNGNDLEWRTNDSATHTIKAWTSSGGAHAYQRFYPSNGATWSHGVRRDLDQYRIVDGLDITSNARLVINGSDGNVGINTTTPRGKLDVSGSFLGSVTDITPTNQTASLDCSLGNFFTLTLSSSADTFLTASNIQPGQSINLRITQPATSGSLSYGPEFKFPNGAPYAVSATSSVEDILSFIAFDASSLYGSSLKNFQ